MGCDIHGHIEIKFKGKWYHWGQLNIRRDYALFAKMAGVRNWWDSGVDPIAKPKGFPKNSTDSTKLDRKYWGSDGHSDSWLSAKEMAVLSEWRVALAKERNPKEIYYFEDEFCYVFGNSWDGFSKYPDDRPEGLQDARCIFWFDN